MTIVTVTAGACGFVTKITAEKIEKRTVRIKLESTCDYVDDLGFIFEQNEPLTLKDFMLTNPEKNKVFRYSAEKLPHSACPVPVGIIKAAEVELGLNIPSSVSIVFGTETENNTNMKDEDIDSQLP